MDRFYSRGWLGLLIVVLGGGLIAPLAWAQTRTPRYGDRLRSAPATTTRSAAKETWQTADARGKTKATSTKSTSTASENADETKTPDRKLSTVDTQPRRTVAKTSGGSGSLPNEHGQLWREYDISPYSVRVTSTVRPEQAIVDWILRETGYEAWHSDVVSLLFADRNTLKVYHTPEMHALVADIVDRFVNVDADSQAFSLRVVTVDDPDWRAKVLAMLKPLPVQTQGIQAWVLEKEDAALLSAELRRRGDYHEHSAPQLLVNNGQSAVVNASKPRTYTRDVTLRPDIWPSFEPQLGQFEEGFALELNPLLSLDGRTVDAVIKCNIDQLEKLIPVMLEVPSAVAQRQRTKIEVPQTSQMRLHERFRWPTGQVLLISMGVVATPSSLETPGFKIPLPLSGPARADLLVFVESKGTSFTPPAPTTASEVNVRGRY